MALKHYIICMRDTHFRLIGPFDTLDALSTWANANNPADDPRWQSIEIDEDDPGFIRDNTGDDPSHYMCEVILPTDEPMPD